MDKHLAGGGIPPGQEEQWASMLTYRNSLMQGDADLLSMPQPRTAPGRKGKGAKRKLAHVSKSPFLCTYQKFLVRENTGNLEVWPKHREIWFVQVLDSLILKIKDILIFALKIS